MDVNELVKENEILIENFNVKSYFNKKNYAVYGAINALEITNEVQKNYIRRLDEPKETDELLMQLYGMLQSLFVSVDALYALSYELIGSKKFINLNQNKDMRELKHIRNDVVGHPANRNLRASGSSYCVLEKDNLSSYAFTYLIYNEDSITTRNIELIDLIKAYYEEANMLLKVLFTISKQGVENEQLFDLAEKVIRNFSKNTYLEDLERLYIKYLEKYPNANKKQHRFIWRYELVKKIIDYDFNKMSNLGYDLKNDIIYNELEKIYTIIVGKPNFNKYYHANGTLLKSLFRFVRKNKELYNLKDYLCDFSHPHFYDIFLRFKKKAKNNPTVLEYLSYIEELIEKEDADLIYAYMAPLKAYKKS